MSSDFTETTALRSISVASAHLRVLDGKDAGKEMAVSFPGVTIGSGATADFILSDGAVSREHALLTPTPRGIQLRDLGSKNGTWVGELLVVEAILPPSATIKIGKSTLALLSDPGSTEVPLSEHSRFGDCIGASIPMRHLFALLERAAQSDITVLLEGESGVGKEVLARAIHDHSPRAAGPFVTVDCGAIAPTLLESELFGHERGAFTGANAAHVGLAQRAHGGTLFLDEIGELPLELQPKLLRLLELREVRPVGSARTHRVDVRIVAATNRRLLEEAERRAFRTDLLYRLAVARVLVPPLRERKDDIALLAGEFLSRMRGAGAEFPPQVLALFGAYPWPGNVRELKNAVERFVHLGVTDAGALFDHAAASPAASDLSLLPFNEAKQKFTSAYVRGVLERCGGVIVRAAEAAEVSRPTFYRMMTTARLVPGEGEPDDDL